MLIKKFLFLLLVFFLIISSWGCTNDQSEVDQYQLSTSVEGEGEIVKTPFEVEFSAGSEVDLIASAAAGWGFSHWERDGKLMAKSLDESLNLVVNSNTEVTAVFKPSNQLLNFNVEGEGKVNQKLVIENLSSANGASLPVELEAVPGEEWIFIGWLGLEESKQALNPVVLDRHNGLNIKAIFVNSDYSLSIETNGDGKVKVEEVQVSQKVTGDYAELSESSREVTSSGEKEILLLEGSIIQITAIPATDWKFDYWNKDISGTENPKQIEITGNIDLGVVFEEFPYYSLNSNIDGAGEIEINIISTPFQSQISYSSYPSETELEVKAVPDPGWNFLNWTGSVSNIDETQNPIQILLNKDIDLTAVLEQTQFSVETSVEGSGVLEEKIIEMPEGYSSSATLYPPGSIVEFSATPDTGWEFEQWTGDISSDQSTQNPIQITINDDYKINAVFRQTITDTVVSVNGSLNITHNWPFSTTYSSPSSSAVLETVIVEDSFEQMSDEYREGEIVVGFNRVVMASEQQQVITNLGLNIKAQQPMLNSYLVEIKDGTVKDAVERMLEETGVRYAEPNYIYSVFSTIPDDEYFNYQWHYPQIRLNQAWDSVTGSTQVRIGVLDTGLDSRHPDLQNNLDLEDGYNFPAQNRDTDDQFGHGTHVAGTIAADTNNGIGVAGMMWEAEIIPIKVLDDDGYGSNWDIAQGILYAAGLTDSPRISQTVDVINMSLGGATDSESIRNAVTEADNAGVIIVAAAGNSNTSSPMYPASYPEVISVGSVELNYPDAPIRAPYSNYGDSLDVMAPGGNTKVDTDTDELADGVLSTTFQGSGDTKDYKYIYYQGTSMASPHVAGLAGLMIANGISKTQIRDILRESSFDLGSEGFDTEFGYGLVNAYWAVNQVNSIRILVGSREMDNINAVQETTVALRNGSYVIENVPAGSHSVFGWIDVNANNQIDAGDYLAESDVQTFESGSYQVNLNLVESN